MDPLASNSTTRYYNVFENFESPASICTNSTLVTACDTLTIGGYTIMEPELLPCCLMALIIGLTLAHKTLKIKAPNSLFYAITFATIGVMMTDAGWNDCLLPNLFPNNKFVHFYYAIIDVGLTSTIGFMFMIDGLLDAGVLKPKSPVTWSILATGAIAIFVGWYFALVSSSTLGFFIMYMVVVAIGCGTWVFVQLYLVIRDRDWSSLKWFFLAGSNGGLGFYTLMSSRAQRWLCETYGCHWGTNFIWFLMTDTAMYFIYRYYKARVKAQTRLTYVRQQNKQEFSLPWL